MNTKAQGPHGTQWRRKATFEEFKVRLDRRSYPFLRSDIRNEANTLCPLIVTVSLEIRLHSPNPQMGKQKVGDLK